MKRRFARGSKRFGTLTTWERPGMSGMSWTAPPRPKPRRKPGKETLEILEKGAKLFAEGAHDWPVALDYWPAIPDKEKRQRYRVLKAKHRKVFDELVEKYKTST
jgi:hypothetical protein